MAATDLSAVAMPAVGYYCVRVTLDASAGNAREVVLPEWARRVSVFIADASIVLGTGGIASSGTDGAAIGSDILPITAAGLTWRTAPGRANGGGSMFLTATAASSYAHVMLEQE